MDLQLHINGQRADLSKSARAALTKQVNNVAELKDRQAGFTNRIALPKTKHNNNIFEGANIMQAQSTAPYTKLVARLIVDGEDLVGNGVGRLVGINDNEYSFVVYSGIVGFFDLMGDDTLRDLNLSALNHVRDYATIKASLSNSTGFVYGIADYFNDSPNTVLDLTSDIDVRYLFPCVYLKDIFDAIFDTYGFTYSSAELLNDARFLTAVIPINALVANEEINERLAANGSSTANAPKVYSAAGLGGYLHLPELTVIGGNLESNLTNAPIVISAGGIIYTGALDTYEVFVDGVYNIAAQFIYTSGATVAGALSIACVRAGTTTLTPLEDYSVLINQSGTVVDLIYSGAFTAGDRIFIYGSSLLATGMTVGAPCSMAVTATEIENNFGSTWYTQYLLPPIKVKQLLKDVAQLFSLVFDRERFSNTVQIFNMNTVRNNIPIAVDWSDKLNASNISQSFTFGKYAQENWIRYKEDATLQDTTAFDGYITSNNENLDRAADIIKPNFAGTDEVPRLDGELIANFPLFAFDADDAEYKATEKIAPRIAYITRLSKSVNITDGTTTEAIVSAPVVSFNSGDNSFHGDNMLADYYGTINNMLQNTKAINARFKLTGNDVANIDFSVPIYIEYFNAYFYLNKIQSFLPNRLTACQLVKIQ